jgi:hypothetical protein
MSVLMALSILSVLLVIPLHSSHVKQLFYQEPFADNVPPPMAEDEGPSNQVPSPPRSNQVGTVIDSTIYDYQFSIIGQRIACIGDSALHIGLLVSTDPSFTPRGMRYLYYINDLVTNFGFIEGTGIGNQRGGFGSVISYDAHDLGIGNVAIMTSHTNLSGRALGAHWYGFQDAFQGIGAFTPYEGWWGDGSSECHALQWPGIAIVNDATGSMAMTGRTGDVTGGCQGGTDDIYVIQKNFNDAEWGDAALLESLDDPTAWNDPGPNTPRIAATDEGYMVIVSSEFGTNVYYWESTDGGLTWGDRLDVTGFPIGPHKLPPDTSSTDYRPLQNHSIGMSPDGTPHIVWTAYQAQGVLPDSTYTPGVDAIWQYRTKLEHWDPIHGVNTIYRHPVGLADFAGGTQYFAYNIARPTIGFDESGQTIYVAYEGFVDADFDPTNQISFGDIYVSVSTDGGETWKDRVNVTNTIGSDDLFPAIASVNQQGAFDELDGFSVGAPDGINDFIMTYQNDDVAGTFLGGEETSPNWDMLLLAPVDFDAITATGVIGDGNGDPKTSIPRAHALGQNYPNPFNPSTAISYQLAERAAITIRIHNVRGQMVRELVNDVREAGTYSVQWNGKDELGRNVSSGVYLYTLETDRGFRSSRKMVVLK